MNEETKQLEKMDLICTFEGCDVKVGEVEIPSDFPVPVDEITAADLGLKPRCVDHAETSDEARGVGRPDQVANDPLPPEKILDPSEDVGGDQDLIDEVDARFKE